MQYEVIIPRLSANMEEAKILKWHKKVGDIIKEGEELLELETDKAIVQVEAEVRGTLKKIVHNEGEKLPVTTVVGFIEQV
ncbi:MAG: biotin attachment protein [Candidatus Omnitrophica bacterium]|nr:biotin attachment protein [Candidatus Omnitrophota bacterium]